MKYEHVTKTNYKLSANAEWEIRTTGFIDHQNAMQRFNSIRTADEAALDSRRRRLADMLAREQALFQEQLEQLDESPEQRKARMEARANELKDKREGERLAYVRQQYERQWRLACDPLREQESKEILKATNAARAYQIGEKMKALEMEEQETRAFDELWEQDRLAKLGREEAEESARKQMDFEHKLVLDQQVGELHRYREDERTLAAQEAELLRQQVELEKTESKRVETMRHDVLMQANADLHAFNKHKRSMLADAVDAERKADAERLAATLAKEKAEDQREAAARSSMQAQTRMFAEHMLMQKRQIAAQEGVMEEARQKELAKAWDKRLEVWGREQEARENLMAQVLEERKEQVKNKLNQVRIDKQKQADARARLEAELAKVNAIEADKAAGSKAVRMEHRSLLENQIKDKAFKRAAADFNKAQERMTAERAEAAYQMMLSDQMAKTTGTMTKYAQQ